MKNRKIFNGGNQVKTRRILWILVPVLYLTLMLGSCDTINGNNASNGVLTGSGTIGAREVKISSALGGTVSEVLVEEGQYVNEGDLLFRTDDDLLQAERDLSIEYTCWGAGVTGILGKISGGGTGVSPRRSKKEAQ